MIGTLAGAAADAPTLILNDHLDTYPAGDPSRWDKTGGEPYRATRDGDFLYARGTSDTRGNLACIILAVEALQRAGIRLTGNLKCVFTVDEEKNGPDGSIFLLDQHGLRADYEITCEPTGWTRPDGSWGMDIGVANSGHFLVEIETRGIKTHIWRPDTGTNAVSEMGALIAALETTRFGFKPAKLPGGTPPMLTPVRIGGGVPGEMQFTPDRCTAVFAVVGLAARDDRGQRALRHRRGGAGVLAPAHRPAGAGHDRSPARCSSPARRSSHPMPSRRLRSAAPTGASCAASRAPTARTRSTTPSASPSAASPP